MKTPSEANAPEPEATEHFDVDPPRSAVPWPLLGTIVGAGLVVAVLLAIRGEDASDLDRFGSISSLVAAQPEQVRTDAETLETLEALIPETPTVPVSAPASKAPAQIVAVESDDPAPSLPLVSRLELGDTELAELLGARIAIVMTSPREELRLSNGRRLRVGDSFGEEEALVLESIESDQITLVSESREVLVGVR